MMISQPGTDGPVVKLDMKFRAPRAKIWQAWTEPDILRRWHMADAGFRCTKAAVDLKPLGAFSIVMEPPAGNAQFEVKGNYVEVISQEQLVYTWAAMSEPRYWTLVTARFLTDGSGSRLELEHGVFKSEQDRLAHEQGWLGCLSHLPAVLDEPMESP